MPVSFSQITKSDEIHDPMDRKIDSENFYINTPTLELLNPLYPTLITTQSDVDNIIESLKGDYDFQKLLELNLYPGMLDAVWEPFNYETGVGGKIIRIFEDITAYNNFIAKCPTVPDYRLYRIDGTNLIKISDNSVVEVLTPIQYIRWLWFIKTKIFCERSDPIEI